MHNQPAAASVTPSEHPAHSASAVPAARGGGTWEPALSISRAKEYQKCPLQYRLHVVDGIRDPATPATALGTLVHSVLEHLFDAAPADRTPDHAQELVGPAWDRLSGHDATVLDLFADRTAWDQWIDRARGIIAQYFRMEDPRWLSPASREHRVDVITPDGIRLRGFIDRVDRSPAGDLRVVDYKTGRAPQARFVEEALDQLRFYAVLLRESDRLPARTQLLYLVSGQVLTLDPSAADIERFAGRISQLWERIEADARAGSFRPRRNPLCNWCRVQALCPLFGGTTPDLPPDGLERLLTTRVTSATGDATS